MIATCCKRFFLCLFFLFSFLPMALAYDFGNEEVGLPAFSKDSIPSFKSIYQLQFLPDAYPGKYIESDNLVVPHPIYGAYVIYDYLLSYGVTKDPKYLEGALKVADAALNRMEYLPEFDALVFWYEPESKVSSAPIRFYSGLTQSRYLYNLARLSRLSGQPKYKEAADKIFNSLLIPVEKGGVFLQTPYGPMIEEYPFAIPTYVLNGWQTCILEVYKYAKETGRKDLLTFVDTNLDAMEKVLPLFDLPDLQNTRDQLTGFNFTRTLFAQKNNCTIKSFKTKVGNQFYSSIENDQSRWNNYILKKNLDEEGFPKDKAVQMNTVYSFINDEQNLELVALCKAPDKLKLYVSNGDYNPLQTAMPAERWVYIGEKDLQAGENHLAFTIDNADIRLVAYPTNFLKPRGKGKATGNSYQFIHYKRLEEILGIRPDSAVFKHYAEKWKDYPKYWETVDAITKKTVDLSDWKFGVKR